MSLQRKTGKAAAGLVAEKPGAFYSFHATFHGGLRLKMTALSNMASKFALFSTILLLIFAL